LKRSILQEQYINCNNQIVVAKGTPLKFIATNKKIDERKGKREK
jgi:hypothetical protein